MRRMQYNVISQILLVNKICKKHKRESVRYQEQFLRKNTNKVTAKREWLRVTQSKFSLRKQDVNPRGDSPWLCAICFGLCRSQLSQKSPWITPLAEVVPATTILLASNCRRRFKSVFDSSFFQTLPQIVKNAWLAIFLPWSAASSSK